jgi:hypothetical protein
MSIHSINQFIVTGQVIDFPQAGLPYYFDRERLPVNYTRLVPGYIYSFNSTVPVGEDSIPSLDDYQSGQSHGKKPYYDNRPIFLSLGQEGPMEVGFNLKLMPIQLRKWFLQKYLKQMFPLLEKLVEPSGNFIELNKRMRMQVNSPFYRLNRGFIGAVSEQSGLKLGFLIDKYTRGEIGNPLALIDWDDVPKLSTTNYVNDGSIVSKTPIAYFLTKFS